MQNIMDKTRLEKIFELVVGGEPELIKAGDSRTNISGHDRTY